MEERCIELLNSMKKEYKQRVDELQEEKSTGSEIKSFGAAHRIDELKWVKDEINKMAIILKQEQI